MKKILEIFKIRREERLAALLLLVVQILLNALVIYKYYGIFTPLKKYYWPLFIRNFHVSGFDPITYSVVSDWTAGYNVFRHPLLAFYMYIPYLINQALIYITGINCAIFVVAAMQMFCFVYSMLFFYRILREITELDRCSSVLLSAFFFSFAYVMISAIVPDHFIMSMMLLLLALYVSGLWMKRGNRLGVAQSVLLFVLTAGVSLNNGLKIYLSGLFVNGRKFFRIKYIAFAVILPAALLWGISKWEYNALVWPVEVARHKAQAEKKAKKQKKELQMRLAQAGKDSAKGMPGDTLRAVNKTKEKPKHSLPRQGKPIGDGAFMRWTDISTSRIESAIENLFGESIQLHQDYLLQDVLRKRPMIVHYSWAFNYFIEAVVLLLFAAGIFLGRHSRFLWLCMSYFGLDMLLHLGLGFGLNEVYIMSAHWIYVIPIAVAYAIKSLPVKHITKAQWLVFALAAYLFIYNVTLISKYLIC